MKIGTLRSAAAARGIKAITVEIGNPQTFQDRYVQVRLSIKTLSSNLKSIYLVVVYGYYAYIGSFRHVSFKMCKHK